MTDKAFDVHEQMSRSRYINGRHERLENGVWVPWPVLKMDRYGQREVAREERREPRQGQNGFNVRCSN